MLTLSTAQQKNNYTLVLPTITENSIIIDASTSMLSLSLTTNISSGPTHRTATVSSDSQVNTGAVVGAIVGGVLMLLLILTVVIVCVVVVYRRKTLSSSIYLLNNTQTGKHMHTSH